MQTLWQDLRYTVRSLLTRPGFAAAVVLTLGLGIGANAVIFTWLKAVLLDPLPGVQHVNELVHLSGIQGDRGGLSNSYNEYLYFRDHSTVFSGLLSYELVELNLSDAGKPELVHGGVVSGNYFDVLGVHLALGRSFRPEEGTVPDAYPVAVISYPLWQRRFGGAADVLGRTVSLNRTSFTVIGVAPRGFAGVYGGLAEDLWVPVVMVGKLLPDGDRLLHRSSWMQIMGRKRPGVSLSQVQAEIKLLAAQFAAQNPERLKGWTVRVDEFSKSPRGFTSSVAPLVEILQVVVGLVLLIACANIANLLLARAITRRKEVAVRLALGASPGRVVQQLLTESLLLAVFGGALGLFLASALAGTLSWLAPPIGIRFAPDVHLDYRVFAFTALITLATGILFGMAPALQAARADVTAALKDEAGPAGGGRSKTRLRSALVMAQVALSVVGLVGAGLFLRTMAKATMADPGFDRSQALLASFNLNLNRYDSARGLQFERQLLERVRTLAGVRTASLSSYVPMGLWGGSNSRAAETIEGYAPGPNESLNIVCDNVGPEYFTTMRIPLAAGREFTDQDRENTQPVVIVNQTMAQRYWPGRDPIGQHLKIGGKWRQIVGVARNITYRSVSDEPEPAMYLPLLQDYEPSLTLVVRTEVSPYAVLAGVEDTVSRLDSGLSLSQIESLEAHVAGSLFQQRDMAFLLSAFGLLALALTAVGLNGVFAYTVSQRTHEIGIRMALGAQPRDVLRLVVGQGAKPVVAGVGIGLVASWALMRLLTSLLYGVSASDPLTFIGVAILLTAVALVASYLPARRAMSVDPLVALRYE